MHVLPGIRLATPEDAGAIAALSRDTIEQGLRWRWTPLRVLRAMRNRSTNVAVAHEFRAVLGFSIMQFDDEAAHLLLLAVQPALRERGLGRMLLEWQEECARVAGLASIRCEARADNAVAVAFYVDQGWRCTGTVQGYYEGRIAAVRLEKRLIPG